MLSNYLFSYTIPLALGILFWVQDPEKWVAVKVMVSLLGPLNTRCPIVLRTQEGIIILRTTHLRTSRGFGIFFGQYLHTSGVSVHGAYLRIFL